jgi:hypothetical protein
MIKILERFHAILKKFQKKQNFQPTLPSSKESKNILKFTQHSPLYNNLNLIKNFPSKKKWSFNPLSLKLQNYSSKNIPIKKHTK